MKEFEWKVENGLYMHFLLSPCLPHFFFWDIASATLIIVPYLLHILLCQISNWLKLKHVLINNEFDEIVTTLQNYYDDDFVVIHCNFVKLVDDSNRHV